MGGGGPPAAFWNNIDPNPDAAEPNPDAADPNPDASEPNPEAAEVTRLTVAPKANPLPFSS